MQRMMSRRLFKFHASFIEQSFVGLARCSGRHRIGGAMVGVGVDEYSCSAFNS